MRTYGLVSLEFLVEVNDKTEDNTLVLEPALNDWVKATKNNLMKLKNYKGSHNES